MLVLALAVSRAHADRIDDYLRAELPRRHLPGLSVAVVRDGRVVKAQGYGLANLEHGVPASKDSVYRLASVSKQFTASALMLLVQDGKLSLDAPIAQFLPGAPESWNGLTMRELLTHTSGVRTWDGVSEFTFRHDYRPEEFITFFGRFPLNFAPRERWSYTNTGYALLGLIIEKVSGKLFKDFLTERLFQPSGMTATSAREVHELVPHRAEGYLWQDGKHVKGEYHRPRVTAPSGGVLSSVVDLAKWDAVLRSEKLLTRASLEQMGTPVQLANGSAADYGFGWRVDDHRGHRLLQHSGSTPGFSTHFARFVDDRLTVIVLTNLNNGGATVLAKAVAGLVRSELAPPELIEPQPDPEPSMRPRALDFLVDLAHGKTDSPLMTLGMQTAVNPRGDAALQRRLKEFESFGFLAADSFKDRTVVVRGAPATRVLHYQLKTARENWYHSIYLTAENRVAQHYSYSTQE